VSTVESREPRVERPHRFRSADTLSRPQATLSPPCGGEGKGEVRSMDQHEQLGAPARNIQEAAISRGHLSSHERFVLQESGAGRRRFKIGGELFLSNLIQKRSANAPPLR
jgi:hypothetical protein